MAYALIDGHCDTISRFMEVGGNLYSNDGQVDLKRLKGYESPCQVFALWLDEKYYSAALRQTLKMIDFFQEQMKICEKWIRPVYTYADYEKNRREKKMSALLSVEGGEALEGEISSLHILHQLGVRMMTLTWNHRNALADGVGESISKGGLTTFGRLVVEEMERLSMIVDVSHLSDKGFWDTVSMAKRPVVASHSNARGVYPVPRNLTDEQIRAIAETGGVVGVNFFTEFLGVQGTIDDVLLHIDHILSAGGEDVLALGSDFDGISSAPNGLEDVSKTGRLIDKVEKKYGSRIAEKFSGGNYRRVFREILTP